MPHHPVNNVKQENWLDDSEYTMEDLALDIEVLESCKELYHASVKDEVGNLWFSLDSKGFLECDDEFKELVDDVLKGLQNHLIKPDKTGHMTNRVKFVQMGFRLIHVKNETTNYYHVLKLYHPGSKSHILFNYA